MATSDLSGEPHVAKVATLEEDGTIWLATDVTSAKARNLAENPRIALMWTHDSETYVWGDAELVDDMDEKRRIWEGGLLPYDPAMFFGSVDNPNLVLVRITPVHATVQVMGADARRWTAERPSSENVLPGVVLVTGANRGLGFEVCRQLGELGATVFLGSRDVEAGQRAAAELTGEGHDVRAIQLDVTDSNSVAAAAGAIGEQVSHVDAVVNNAGGNFDWMHEVIGSDVEDVIATTDANCFGTMRVTNAFLGLLGESDHPRLVNVSSEAGSHASPQGLSKQQNNLAGYAVAKAALAAYTVKLAAALADTDIVVNLISPGFVATQPGSEKMGARPVPEGAASVVWGVTLPDDGPRGGFFRHGERLSF